MMMAHFRLLSATRARISRKAFRDRGWAQRIVFLLFVVLGAAVFFGSFFFFSRSFSFITAEPLVGPVIARYVLESTMHVIYMLGTASFLLIAVRFLFSAKEVRLLATLPVAPSELFLYRFLSATAFASWPVLLLGVPAVVAMGNVVSAGPYYYIGAFGSLLTFLLLIALTGSVLAFAVAPLARRMSRTVGFLAQISAFIGFAFLLIRTTIPRGIFGSFFDIHSSEDALQSVAYIRDWFIASPSHAYVESLGSILPFSGSVQGLPLLLSGIVVPVLVLTAILHTLVVRQYLRMIQAFGETGFLARPDDVTAHVRRETFPSIFKWKHGFLFEKDFLSFFRNPNDVSHASFLGVMLIFYMLAAKGITSMGQFDEPRLLVVAVTFAFGALGYFALTFALRFAFPSLSLEGKSAWVLWSSPLHIHEFFSWKLFFWGGLLTAAMEAVAIMTVLLFGLPVILGLFLMFAVLCASVTVTAIALGQGSIYPDFAQDDPDVLTTSPAGLVATGLGIMYLFIVGRYVYRFADTLLSAGQVDPLAGSGVLIVTMTILTAYWIIAPRSMEAREIP